MSLEENWKVTGIICFVPKPPSEKGGSLKPQIVHWPSLCVLDQWAGDFGKGASLGLWEERQEMMGPLRKSLALNQQASHVRLFSPLVSLSANFYIKSCFVFTSLLNLLSYFQQSQNPSSSPPNCYLPTEKRCRSFPDRKCGLCSSLFLDGNDSLVHELS